MFQTSNGIRSKSALTHWNILHAHGPATVDPFDLSNCACSHAADSALYDGGRGDGDGEHSTSAVEEALRRQMEMQKMLQSQLEVQLTIRIGIYSSRLPVWHHLASVRRFIAEVYRRCRCYGWAFSADVWSRQRVVAERR